MKKNLISIFLILFFSQIVTGLAINPDKTKYQLNWSFDQQKRLIREAEAKIRMANQLIDQISMRLRTFKQPTPSSKFFKNRTSHPQNQVQMSTCSKYLDQFLATSKSIGDLNKNLDEFQAILEDIAKQLQDSNSANNTAALYQQFLDTQNKINEIEKDLEDQKKLQSNLERALKACMNKGQLSEQDIKIFNSKFRNIINQSTVKGKRY